MPNTGQRAYYFSDSIKMVLAKILEYPLTIVEAPSGFGKTTAIREFTKARLSLGAREIWYTCFGEPVSVIWNVITEMIADVNVEFASGLRKLEVTRDLVYLPALLRNLRCSVETYFVIDNYQLVDCDIPQLMNMLSMHNNPNLHIIIITQSIEPARLFHNDRVYMIRTPIFLFDLESTARLFRMQGINLSRKELDAVFCCTEGWVSAIRLQIANYKENGFLGLTIGIEQLVEMAIWNRLTAEEKDFLQSVAVMDSFDARQAVILSGKNMLPENIERLLKFNEFIRYNPNKRLYTLHSILREYLLNRFYYYKSLDFQRGILRLVGQCYAAVSQFHTAAQFLYKAGDYDAIFSLPVHDAYIGNRKEDDILDFIKELIDHCPEQTLLKYPSVLVKLSSYLYAGGYFETYQKLRRLIELSVEKANLDDNKLCRLRSEYFVMTLMEEYAERGCQREKPPNFVGITQKIKRDIPFTFGCPSVLFLFWREAGQLENEMHNFAENLPAYCEITQGHGLGADSLMRAEAMLMRGEDLEAETLCHMALYQAKNCENQQVCICLGAEFVLARIAILRGDVEAYFSAINNLQSYTDVKSDLYVRRMVELCLAGLNYIIGDTRPAASWINDLESIRRILYYPVIPYALIFYSDILLNSQRYNEYLGLFQAVMGTAGKNNMLLKIYFFKYLSIINLKNGNYQKAQAFYNQAISISLADKVYLPLAQQAEEMSSLLISAKSETSDKEGMDALIALSRRQKRGVAAIRNAVFKAQSPLTPREREIALLVRDRFSAQEIAEMLYISKATVKTVIRNIYSKLNIHSRSDLFVIEL
jgi:LuxR family maltose regulon positive regulatory protein